MDITFKEKNRKYTLSNFLCLIVNKFASCYKKVRLV